MLELQENSDLAERASETATFPAIARVGSQLVFQTKISNIAWGPQWICSVDGLRYRARERAARSPRRDAGQDKANLEEEQRKDAGAVPKAKNQVDQGP